MCNLDQVNSIPQTYSKLTNDSVAEVKNPNGKFPLLLICEHASNYIPPEFDNLGIDEETATSHAAYDIGIREVAVNLSNILDAPLVVSNISRLVIDCNREPYSPDSTPAQSEIYSIPKNANISPQEKSYRVKTYYQPFHDCIRNTMLSRTDLKVLLALHSFTPVFMGIDREMEIGVLFEQDNQLSRIFLQSSSLFSNLITVANEPYAPDPKVSHTIKKHATPFNLPNLMLEIRNSLIRNEKSQWEIAEIIAKMIQHSMREFNKLNKQRNYPEE